MSLNKKDLDALYDRLRQLERGGTKTPEEIIFDKIFDRLRALEDFADELRILKYKLIGAAVVVSALAGLALKLL